MAARTRGETAGKEKPWWTVPENFVAPLVFYMDEELEESIFGPRDPDLRRIEEHSGTLIQLERWFSASGQTCVMIVGPIPARRWLLDMALSLGSSDFELQAQGRRLWLNCGFAAGWRSHGGVTWPLGFSRISPLAENQLSWSLFGRERGRGSEPQPFSLPVVRKGLGRCGWGQVFMGHPVRPGLG
nr:putative KHDC1-like protein [Loxodonta africana]